MKRFSGLYPWYTRMYTYTRTRVYTRTLWLKPGKKFFLKTIAYKTDIIKKWIKNQEDIMKIWYIREIFDN